MWATSHLYWGNLNHGGFLYTWGIGRMDLMFGCPFGVPQSDRHLFLYWCP